MTLIGESMREIQNIAEKYFKTIKDINEAENKLREALKKEGYYRY